MQIKYRVLSIALLTAISVAAPAEETMHLTPPMISQKYDVLTHGNQKQIQQIIQELSKAAEKHSSEAQRMLGEIYSKGRGVEKDMTRAFKYYAEAARQFDSVAQYELAKAYFKGSGTDPNMISAYIWASLSQLKESSIKEQTAQLQKDISKLLTSEQIEKAQILSTQLQQIYLKN
ncbi:MAG: sel1 repeat family protein [Endozoicomonadaceae bacterium]|nr:sel1 repeat family protein [Endozoicomonadaceae bacterium]